MTSLGPGVKEVESSLFFLYEVQLLGGILDDEEDAGTGLGMPVQSIGRCWVLLELHDDDNDDDVVGDGPL